MAEFSLTSLYPPGHIAQGLTFVAQPDRRQMSDRRKNWRGGRRVSDFSALARRAVQAAQPFEAHDKREMRAERLH